MPFDGRLGAVARCHAATSEAGGFARCKATSPCQWGGGAVAALPPAACLAALSSFRRGTRSAGCRLMFIALRLLTVGRGRLRQTRSPAFGGPPAASFGRQWLAFSGSMR